MWRSRDTAEDCRDWENQRERSIVKHRGERPRKREVCVRVGEDSTETKERHREKVWYRGSRQGVVAVAVTACEHCTVSAAARVILYSNPRIKTSADSLRQITDIFPLFPHVPRPNDDCCMPWTFVLFVLLFSFYRPALNISYKAAGLWREKKEGGQKNTTAHAEFLHTARLSYLPWGSTVRSPGIQTAVQVLPLHLNLELLLL